MNAAIAKYGLFLILVLMLCQLPVFGSKPDTAYKISRMKAQLFYSDTQTFSPNIMDNNDFTLWNVFEGDGSTNGHPANATLIIVEVTGSKKVEDANPPDIELTFKIMDSVQGRVSSKRVFSHNFAKDGKYSVATVVDDTVCIPLSVTAKLLGKNTPSSMTKTIQFGCGE